MVSSRREQSSAIRPEGEQCIKKIAQFMSQVKKINIHYNYLHNYIIESL